MMGRHDPSARTAAVACIALGIGIGLMSCGGGHHVSDLVDTEVLDASMSGGDESPPVQTSGSGDVNFVTNRGLDTIAFDVRTEDLDDITSVQIFVGDPGTNGPAIFTLSNDSTQAFAGTLGSGDLMPAPDLGIKTIDDAIDAMVDGRTYVNVLTQAFPTGEIRGQIERQ